MRSTNSIFFEESIGRIVILGTPRTPEVDFNLAEARLVLKGESFPENPAEFYGPLLAKVLDWLGSLEEGGIVVSIAMGYFNSSSAKALMNLFRMLEDAARRGLAVTVDWHYPEDDEVLLESGEDFAEDFEAVRFQLCPVARLEG